MASSRAVGPRSCPMGAVATVGNYGKRHVRNLVRLVPKRAVIIAACSHAISILREKPSWLDIAAGFAGVKQPTTFDF